MERGITGDSEEFYTPAYVVDAARAVMGGIDLDPASCAAAQAVVRADSWCDKETDGIANSEHWSGRVWLNPPGGVSHVPDITRSNQALWWAALALAWRDGNVTEAVFLSYNTEIFSVAQRIQIPGLPQPLDFPFIFPDHRICFDIPTLDGGRIATSQPKYANAIIYLPPKSGPRSGYAAERRFIDTFRAAFRAVGKDCRGALEGWPTDPGTEG